MADDRLTRTCDKCGVADTHAHHVVSAGVTHPVTQEAMDLSITKHIQCCAEDGCEICRTDVEHALAAGHDGIGDGFTGYMQAKSDDHHRALFERHGVESPNHQNQPEGA